MALRQDVQPVQRHSQEPLQALQLKHGTEDAAVVSLTHCYFSSKSSSVFTVSPCNNVVHATDRNRAILSRCRNEYKDICTN